MTKNRLNLNGIWQLSSPGTEEVYEASVPGSVLACMLKEQKTEDPYWGTNEYQVREIFRRDFQYSRDFSLTPKLLEARELTLVFEGIDTIGEVYLNGQLLGKVKDMHRTWRFDVKPFLKEENRLTVYLHSPIAYIEEADRNSDITYCSTGSMLGNGFLRKAHYMFGWDWGPQLPDMGIFRDVYLEYCQEGKLEDVYIRQYHSQGQVKVELQYERKLYGDGEACI